MRLTTFFDPSKGDSFQTDKALAAIKQGGLQGQGMGEGILKERVPEAHTDYIIAVITEEFGSIISILVITIFLYISFMAPFHLCRLSHIIPNRGGGGGLVLFREATTLHKQLQTHLDNR